MGNKHERVAPTKDKPKKKKKVCACLKCSVLTSVATVTLKILDIMLYAM